MPFSLQFVNINKFLRFFRFERTLLKISRFLNLLTSQATKTERPLINCKITFNSLLKVIARKFSNLNSRSCSVWLIHLEWDRFEYQMRKVKVVVLFSVVVGMGQRFGKT